MQINGKSVLKWKGADEIATRVHEMAEELNAIYKPLEGQKIVVLGVLTGAFMFTADLCRHFKFDCLVDFIRVESYQDDKPGELSIKSTPKYDLEDAHVIVVEDILDTGASLTRLKHHLQEQRPHSLRFVVLVANTESKALDLVQPLNFGFKYDGKYILGYGLDSKELHRQLPDIWHFE